ncbi:hypothetical protein [Janthinobacterium agaricidamnosum]|uniref:Putative membrane protein n=1 Tax=Janthinobacterium agaricidamnosum NBRC 102515 = DSM 9628 TaxID=1349767 RepID=W0VE87_9BURK|nr:hypothetical protein [Janthinobacterium agaricidamnosum]CDG85728.1 putative membrane protein [Janthinobacterium agaricidamnosum NBRC 102515 = DSM 9628]
MHSVKVIAGGLLLLALLSAGRGWLAPRSGPGTLLAVFSVAWLGASILNLVLGMRAGYGFSEELPFFLLVFCVPMTSALLWCKQ